MKCNTNIRPEWIPVAYLAEPVKTPAFNNPVAAAYRMLTDGARKSRKTISK